MTDERQAEQEEATDPATAQTGADDPRFEVKWRKRDSGSTPTPPPAEPIQAAGDDAESLRRQLVEAQEQITNLRDRWQRSAADLANLRRHTEQQRSEMEQFASMLLVMELLPVLDNFERAIATIPGNLVMLTWIQGVLLIERHLRAILEHRGVAEVEAEGQDFDPSRHEAISERETIEIAPGKIVAVLQKGYTMHGRVIRPALVEVARAPQPGESSGTVPQEAAMPNAADVAEQAGTENTGP